MSKTNTSKRHKKKDINPALKIRDFYSFSLQILNEINYAREHPDEFIEKLKELQGTIEDSKDNCLFIENVPFIYTNLSGSLNDAIKFLENQNELPKLIYNKSITQACDYLLDELVSHDGLDEENANDYSLENRLSKFGHPFGENYELIDYGMFDPEFIVINFILGDGDKNKFERNIIFNPKVKYIGIASGILSSEKICTIINFCEEFFDLNEKIPLNIEKKYSKLTPSFNTKTINNYSGKTGKSTNVERYTSNTKKEGNTEEQFTEEINTKKGDSGNVFSVKKTEYIKRRESIKDIDEYRKKQKDKKDAKLSLRNKKTKNEPNNEIDFFNDDDDFDDDDFFDKEFDIDFDEDFKGKKKTSKKTTTTTTTTDENGQKKTVVTTVTEEIDDNGNTKKELYEEEENEDENDNNKYPKNKGRENKIKEKQKREKEKENKIIKKQEYEVQEEYEEEEDENNNNIQNNKINSRKEKKDKEINNNLNESKNNNNQNNIKYQRKIIEIPIKIKPKKEEKETYDDSNSSQKYSTYQTYDNRRQHKRRAYNDEFEEEEENDNEYPTDYREEKKKKIKISEDLYEKEEDMDLPDGATNMQVKQKVVTDSNGKPALIIRKTITYEDGTVKTLIEKKPINKK